MATVAIVFRSFHHWGFSGRFPEGLSRIDQASILGSPVGFRQSGYESFQKIDRELGLHVRRHVEKAKEYPYLSWVKLASRMYVTDVKTRLDADHLVIQRPASNR